MSDTKENEQYRLDISNIVVSGDLHSEVDLEEMAKLDADRWELEVKDSKPRGIYFNYEDLPMITLHKSGKYVIRGGSKFIIRETNKEFVKLMNDINVIDNVKQADFGVRNVVGTVTMFDTVIDLERFTTASKENAIKSEYNPEEFSAITYDHGSCKINIFASGKLIITGSESEQKLEKHAEEIVDIVNESIEQYTNLDDDLIF